MTRKDYDAIINFFGEEDSVLCCIKNRIGKEAFKALLEATNPCYCFTNYLADISSHGNVYFMKKSAKSKPNCILIKLDNFPVEMSSRNAVLLLKQDVIKRRDKNTEPPKLTKKEIKNLRGKDIEALRELDYDDFLKTDYWKKVRQEKLRQCGHKCQVCGSTTKLHIHHNTYRHHGDEMNNLKDMVVLCEECHTLFHKYRKLQ